MNMTVSPSARGAGIPVAIVAGAIGLALGFGWYFALIYIWPVYIAVVALAVTHATLVLARGMRWQIWIIGLSAGLIAGLVLSGIVYIGLALFQLLSH